MPKKTATSTRKPRKKAPPARPPVRPADPFPIIGVGASAGGLEALALFLKPFPPRSGLALVIIQHLNPTQKGMLPELLQRHTKMKVVQVKNRTRVRPNCVYVIPPNKDMSILHGVLHLLPPAAHRGLRLPIDFFLQSLALDQQERGVGIILSGMGCDGTLGLKAIKEHAGVALVQEPATAKFDGMPHSAITAGMADIVAAPAELPARLLAYLHHTPLLTPTAELAESGSETHLEKVMILLRAQSGHDFSLYKRATIYRRIERRMGLHHIPKLAAYVGYLRENPQELDLLFKELLIGVTSFFRDPEAWEQLRTVALPALLAERHLGTTLRAWVTGCSTGEEAYSLAITFKEAVDQLPRGGSFSLQIFATDLDRDAVDKARQGFYPASITAHVSGTRLRRFFHREENGYRVAKEIREMIIFAPQNLIMDPPFTKLDILSCRNLLIYLTSALQEKLLPLFHYSLTPGGLLFLGSAESLSNMSGSFSAFSGKTRLFRRQENPPRPGMLEFPSSFVATPPKTPDPVASVPNNLQSLAEHWLFQHHAPAAVLVNEPGDILFISGQTGRYLEPAAGKANWNIFVMARETLRYELATALQKTRRNKGAETIRRLTAGTPRDPHYVDVTVQLLTEPAALRGLTMIVFRETPETPDLPAKKQKSGASAPDHPTLELLRARQELLHTRKEMQSSQEELKSMNEELQSTNEELQSTNEELTTSKEEMQSLNEELQTVNAELQAKVDALSDASNDMRNLLNSTEIATVFLDQSLHVRRFTQQATKIINLIPSDVGRPLTDLASDLLYPELVADAQEVLENLATIVKPVATRNGGWLAMRLMPYRTMDNRIDGVVITFTDMTLARKLEAELLAQKGPKK